MALLGGHLEQVVLILSTGRTGTKAIAHYLNDSCESVVSTHEPKPSRVLRIASFRYLAGRISEVHMVKTLVKKRKTLCSRSPRTSPSSASARIRVSFSNCT